MSFFVQTGPTAKARLNQLIGTSAATGLARNFPTPESRVQKGMLEDAFKKLENAPEGDFLAQLKEIAPSLMSSPGGAELLSSLAPILQQQARNKSIVETVNEARNKSLQPQSRKGNVPEEEIKIKPTPQQEQEKYRPVEFGQQPPPPPEQSNYPSKSTRGQARELMDPDEIDDFARNVVAKSGGMVDYGKGLELANVENSNRNAYNQVLQSEKQNELNAIKEQNADVVSRAENSGLLKYPEDSTVAEKLGHQFKHLNATDRWEKVRDGLREFDGAREQIRRESSLPGPLTEKYRKALGTYKNFKDTIRDLKEPIEIYKRLGLVPELRAEFTNELGWGPEQTEMAIYPFSKEQEEGLEKFDKNSVKPNFRGENNPFPGPEYNLPKEKFEGFKDEIGDYLKENPGTNLISVRGYLNQDKSYSWNDISKAINELQQEKRIELDGPQRQQKKIINQAPLPGLNQILKYMWTGAK